MADQYHLDLEGFSLERFRHILEISELLPSRRILKEKISERFALLETMGIRNLKELTDALSTKKKIARFSQESGLPQDYLEILKRQTKIYTPNPISLKDIPGIAPEYIERLAALGLKQTKQLFNRAKSKKDRAELAKVADVPGDVLLELVKLSDLARAGWVGPIFARLIYEVLIDEAGAGTLEALSKQSPEELFERLQAVNNEQKLTKGSFSVKDVASCIEIAKELPKVIEY
jgi:hypothetical protein